MTPRGSAGWRRLWLVPLLGMTVLVLGLLAPSRAAQAHSLDQYLQASYITVGTDQVGVELDLTPGVLVAPEILAQIDADGDQQISDAEGQAYVAAVLSNVTLQIDGQPVSLAVTRIDMPEYLIIQAGYGTIRVFADAALPEGTTSNHALSYANNYAPTGTAYQVNTFVETGTAITLGTQNRDDIQQSITVDYASGATAPSESTAETEAKSADVTGQVGRLLGYLDAPELTAWKLAAALALAVVLGGLHALTPGHGKGLVAAYLVGSRGTVRHAVALGGIVTFTHTISVIAIGLLALFASQFIVPSVLVPTMQVLSGLLVVAFGARLVWQRLSSIRGRRGAAITHGHDHSNGVTHDHGDGRVHTHLPPAEGLTAGSLVAMGVSGGLVPCPEALGIMIIAVGLNRIVLGLGLIVSFSLGLAAVLIGIGILLVRSRSLIERFGGLGGRWSKVLPLGSAAIVTVLGIGITLNGLATYRRDSSLRSEMVSRWPLLLALVAVAGAGAILFRWWRERRDERAIQDLLPPRYRDGHVVSNAPMGAADLVYEPDGAVAWNAIWGNFCDLALAGGPPHRDTVLQPAPVNASAEDVAYQTAYDEISRGLRLVTGWPTTNSDSANRVGWIGLVCPTTQAARWLTIAITAENIAVRRDKQVIYLPVGAEFRLGHEIKNVVTAVAKTHHYWTKHLAAQTATATPTTRRIEAVPIGSAVIVTILAAGVNLWDWQYPW